MHTYSTMQETDGTYLLLRDGNNVLCPKTLMALPQQTAMGHVGVRPTQMPCCTRCPFASVVTEKRMEKDPVHGSVMKDLGEQTAYNIDCGSQPLKFWIGSPEQKENPKPHKGLISV